ncbi:SGNH/GDSL hydrolase family protein [Candidatus Parcubacteria bacterium]|nr:SGNH/GDSL hydrolase family protein [Patescibacteria group bacterium]MBU4309209.1 SGNH/GDSL hydrolase family protein [Patescibacteria group bacterium]MBU4432627.1 SGNH/GDSL hydrolase family protein [Patescibacteria group bacterium]MBU4577570.1 SGNH/GDSL hydrolase family protein [Patescibacteria group bacterium]MCG2697257.1 SGNH/GDSL hydrolase family protein [Candidatus Parcubacteria bacterium]
MNKKYSKIALIIPVVIIAYLYLAHAYIYRRIGTAHLRATDDRHTYILGNMATSSQKIIYTSLGDSLTAGVGTDKYEESYPYLLAQDLTVTGKVIVHKNFSYPGARTADLVRDLLEGAIAEQPDVVTILIGTNDVHGLVSVVDFQKNYEHILKELTTRTKAKVYVISIPYIGSRSLILPPYSNYFNSKINEFNEVIHALAKTYDLKYIDLTTPTREILKENGAHYADDLFHPSAIGYASWAKIIYDNINQ